MRWGQTTEALREHTENWHVWFAWHPVELHDGRWVWLEKIQRKRYRLLGYTDWLWMYRLPPVSMDVIR